MKVTMVLTDGSKHIIKTKENELTWKIWLTSDNVHFIIVDDDEHMIINKSQIVWVRFEGGR